MKIRPALQETLSKLLKVLAISSAQERLLEHPLPESVVARVEIWAVWRPFFLPDEVDPHLFEKTNGESSCVGSCAVLLKDKASTTTSGILRLGFPHERRVGQHCSVLLSVDDRTWLENLQVDGSSGANGSPDNYLLRIVRSRINYPENFS